MNLSFGKATVNDCPRIRELASRIWGPAYGSILSEEQLNYMFEMMYAVEHIEQQMTESGHEYFIVYADNNPAGYLSIEKKSDDTFIFQKIYTLPELHGKGLGRYLVEQGIAYIKAAYRRTSFTVELYVNRENPAVGFYEHLGMRKIGTRDHDIGNGFYMNDYIMAMKIE
jgi:ribosomal protein S18 acetylase RimI-like enzyme